MRKLVYINIWMWIITSILVACAIPTHAKDHIVEKCLFTNLRPIHDHTGEQKDSIPVSTAELGEIPFFSLPENIVYESKPLQRKYDEIYFPVDKDGKLEKICGRSFKSNMINNGSAEWSRPYFVKSYDRAIKAAGGVKLFEGKFKPGQIQFMKKNAEYLGEEGSLDIYNNTIYAYIIRRQDGADIYIQFDANTAGGAIQIVRKEAFKQTIVTVNSDQISKELNENGKSILYIHFDTDKATLQTGGKKAISEIAKVLLNDKNLKLAVHGYTDNSGSEARNLALSESRADAVVRELIILGVDQSRLSSKGFGASNPLADNNSEAGRAKNRRVELIKQ